MNTWKGKYTVLLKIIGFAFLKSLLLLFYWNLSPFSTTENEVLTQNNPYSALSFWELLLGGLQAEQSRYILFVVIQFFPDFLFYHYICSKYIKDLKENYCFIFVRERNRKRWLKKFSFLSFSNILLYEAITILLLFLAGSWLQENLSIQISKFFIIILCQIVKLTLLTLFCNMLLLRFNEMVSVYGNLLIQSLPLFLVGILYDTNGPWREAIKYLPVYWCHYNYLSQAKMPLPAMLFFTIILGGILYLYSEKLFQNYEAI